MAKERARFWDEMREGEREAQREDARLREHLARQAERKKAGDRSKQRGRCRMCGEERHDGDRARCATTSTVL